MVNLLDATVIGVRRLHFHENRPDYYLQILYENLTSINSHRRRHAKILTEPVTLLTMFPASSMARAQKYVVPISVDF